MRDAEYEYIVVPMYCCLNASTNVKSLGLNPYKDRLPGSNRGEHFE